MDVPIIESPPSILYDILIVHMLVVESTQFGAERGVVCDFIPVVLKCRTTPTLKVLDLKVLLIAFFIYLFCEHAIPLSGGRSPVVMV